MKYSKALIKQIRCDLLSHTTDAEKAAAKICTQLGYKVIPQQPIVTGRKLYFADIYLPEIKTIIELDGATILPKTKSARMATALRVYGGSGIML